jgi:putative transposase
LTVRDLVRQVCRANDIEILAGHVRPDHVHLLLSVPPHLAPSRVMQAVKGKTSHRLLQDSRRLRREFWGRHLWARGYFVCSSGNVTDELIEEYIRNQGAKPQDDEAFKITE